MFRGRLRGLVASTLRGVYAPAFDLDGYARTVDGDGDEKVVVDMGGL